MEKINNIKNEKRTIFLFFLVPTIMLIFGYFAYPFIHPSPPTEISNIIIQIPIFLGLILLGIGFFWKNKNNGRKIKIAGWFVFAFYWSMMPMYLYLAEYGDIFNGVVCVIGVYVLIYIAYHEWLSLKGYDDVTCLNWAAGAAFIAGIIYFTIESEQIVPVLKDFLIKSVASESAWLLNLFGANAYADGDAVIYQNFPISIIFACTAIQAMTLFAGMILALYRADWKRKTYALLLTILPMYILNFVRTSSVVYLVAGNITSFEIAHNLLSKLGALITLIVLLFITFKILPELLDEIMCLIDLPKRNGPIEKFLGKYLGRKKKA